MPKPFFNIGSLTKNPLVKPLLSRLERFLKVHSANKLIEEILRQPSPSLTAQIEAVLHQLGTSYSFEQKALNNIPSKGPLIIVSNHPLGIVDGLLQAHIALHARDDVKILSNDLLTSLPGLDQVMINANNWDESKTNKTHNNSKAMRKALSWLNEGHCLCVFPAGEVASWQWRQQSIVEPPWQNHIVRLACKTGSHIIPVHFDNTNSNLFHASGILHPFLRTIQLLREAFCQPKTVTISIGQKLSSNLIAKLPSSQDQTDFIRQATLCLAQKQTHNQSIHLTLERQKNQCELAPIATLRSKNKLCREIQALPASAMLLDGDRFSTYATQGKNIPTTLHEIGRLREITFRLSQEGSGLALDLDEYDQESWQLFLWDKQTHQIAGAYRLNLIEKLDQDFYSKTLFTISKKFAQVLFPAIELGRSFIAPEYQRRPLSLFLLWQGIGEFMYQNQKFTTLFGPVSIANDYSASGKSILCNFLKQHHGYPNAKHAVRPKQPWTMDPDCKETLGSMSNNYTVDHFNALIQTLEDGRGMPILLKHYLKIHCKILDFNVDPLFSDVLDGFILIDTKNIKASVLKKYCNIYYNHSKQRLEKAESDK